MGGISDQYNLADPETWGTSLLKFVGTHADEFVIAWFWVSGKDLLESHWLPLYDFLTSEVHVVAVRYSPKSIVRDLRGHIPSTC